MRQAPEGRQVYSSISPTHHQSPSGATGKLCLGHINRIKIGAELLPIDVFD